MAASDARPVPRRNTAYRLYLAIRDGSGALVTGWTGADTELSLDGAAFSDATNELTEIGSSGCGYIEFTAGEMNYDAVVIKSTVTNVGAIPVVLVLYPEEAGDYRADMNGDLTSTMKASVNAEVLDVLATHTFAELSSPPAATSSLKNKITWLFMWARNRSTQSTTERKLYADDGTTVVSTETTTDNGTTYDKGEAT